MPQYLNMMMVFGAACFAIMMLLVALGESPLPLFGGDRELAARVYKTVFVALSAGTVAGVAPAGMTNPDYSRLAYCGSPEPRCLHLAPRRCSASPVGLDFGLLTLILPRYDLS